MSRSMGIAPVPAAGESETRMGFKFEPPEDNIDSEFTELMREQAGGRTETKGTGNGTGVGSTELLTAEAEGWGVAAKLASSDTNTGLDDLVLESTGGGGGAASVCK